MMKLRAGKAAVISLLFQPKYLMAIFICLYLCHITNAESGQIHKAIPAKNSINFQGEGFTNIALNRPVYTSHYLTEQPHIYAVDGNLDSLWNSGERPREWIKIDLGSESLIERVRLLVAQLPAGSTVHEIYFADQEQNYTLAHTFSMFTDDDQWLEYIPGSMPADVRYVLIRTVESPSWVAWREIEVIGETMEEDDNHIKYFGYYWGASSAIGNFMDEFEDHCNFVHITGNDIEYLQNAKGMNLKAILNIGHIFRMCEGPDCLYDDYLTRWNDYADMISPYMDTVLGFYPYDEPYLNNNPLEDQEKVTQAIKSRFSDKPVFVTFAYLSISNSFEMPEGYDIVSITPEYGDFSGQDMLYFLNILKMNLRNDQKIILTGDGFSLFSNPASEDQYNRVITAREFYNIAKIDPLITGIWTFIWPSFESFTGVRDMPIVEKEFRRIGLEVLKNNSDTDSGRIPIAALSLLLFN